MGIISGKIIEGDELLIGVIVVVVGILIGIIIDLDGNYSIFVDVGIYVLEVFYIGFLV